jgi:hypothetical protein
MLCYVYGINHMDSRKCITGIYTGTDEAEEISIAKDRNNEFVNTIVKGFGQGGVLYH